MTDWKSILDWKNPDYTPVWEERQQRIAKMRKEPEIVPGLKEFYKDNPIQFILDFGVTTDPRNIEIGLSPVMPFILFKRQEEFILWLLERWRNREGGLVEKSRDMGITWLCVAFSHWMWTFYPGSVIGFGSRKEEYVDRIGDPKSIFWKIREYLRYIPYEFAPVGFIRKKHAPYMSLINPENGASIAGEAGDNIGRGNRTSIYLVDEAAHIEHQQLVNTALSQTTNCQIDLSSVNGNGNAFFQKRHSGRVPVFTFHWRDDPRKGPEWYAKECARLDPVIVAQEVDIDYNASTADSWIDGAKVSDAQNRGPADIEVNGPWFIGVDAAHFGDDESVITARRGRLTLPQWVKRKLDGPTLAGVVIDICDRLVANGGVIGAIVIELDGPGVSCYDNLMRSKYDKYVVGLHTGAKLDDDLNLNIRAKLWRSAKDYFDVGGCSMPMDIDLKSQLSSIKYTYRDGLLLMENKKEYKKRIMKSPDRADSFILTFGGMPAKKKKEIPQGEPFEATVEGCAY